MTTFASIVLYALAAFTACVIGFGAGKVNGTPDDKTSNELIGLFLFMLVLFILAVGLQVFG